MKICLINNLFGKQARGGAEKIIFLLANYLLSKGHNVSIICGDDVSAVEVNMINGLKIFSLPSKYKKLSSKNIYYRWFFHVGGFLNIVSGYRFKKIIEHEKFDLVWTNNLIGFGLLSFFFLRKSKLIHTFHDIQLLHPGGLMIYGHENILKSLFANFYQFLVKIVFPKNISVIFPSLWLKSIYEQRGFNFKHSFVLSNPVDFSSVSLPKEKEHFDNCFSFLYLGQLEYHKGVELLIKSFLNLKNKKAKLIIVGSGSLETSLRKKYSIYKNIEFLGQVDNIENVFITADCLVVPSLCYENLPTVILEAKKYNLSVIGSDLGGIKEMINEEKLLFLPKESNLTQTLNWAINNKSILENLSKNIREKKPLIDVDDYLSKVGRECKIIF